MSEEWKQVAVRNLESSYQYLKATYMICDDREDVKQHILTAVSLIQVIKEGIMLGEQNDKN